MILAPFLPRSVRLLGIVGAFAVAGCRNLDNFDTKPGYAYCGAIPASPVFQEGFVPDNQPPTLELALTLDTGKITGQPGILSSNDAGSGLCGAQPLFLDAPIRAIPEVDHDALSTLTFGEGHEHDFFVWVDSTCQGTMLALVSLIKNNQVELRLFKPARLPAPDSTPTAGEKPGFALFHLDLKPRARTGINAKDSCGF
jgi:hypothetical protein